VLAVAHVRFLFFCSGEKAILVIKPSAGYGAEGAGGVIPGGATLLFEASIDTLDREKREC
jgi:hypothetical protein